MLDRVPHAQTLVQIKRMVDSRLSGHRMIKNNLLAEVMP